MSKIGKTTATKHSNAETVRWNNSHWMKCNNNLSKVKGRPFVTRWCTNGKYCCPYDVPGPSCCLKTATKIRRSLISLGQIWDTRYQEHLLVEFVSSPSVYKTFPKFHHTRFFWVEHLKKGTVARSQSFSKGKIGQFDPKHYQTPKVRGTKIQPRNESNGLVGCTH